MVLKLFITIKNITLLINNSTRFYCVNRTGWVTNQDSRAMMGDDRVSSLAMAAEVERLSVQNEKLSKVGCRCRDIGGVMV